MKRKRKTEKKVGGWDGGERKNAVRIGVISTVKKASFQHYPNFLVLQDSSGSRIAQWRDVQISRGKSFQHHAFHLAGNSTSLQY